MWLAVAEWAGVVYGVFAFVIWAVFTIGMIDVNRKWQIKVFSTTYLLDVLWAAGQALVWPRTLYRIHRRRDWL